MNSYEVDLTMLSEYELVQRLIWDIKSRTLKKCLFYSNDGQFNIKIPIHTSYANNKSILSCLHQFLSIMNHLKMLNEFVQDDCCEKSKKNIILESKAIFSKDIIVSLKFALNFTLCDWYNGLEGYTNLYNNITLLNFYLKVKDYFKRIEHLYCVIERWKMCDLMELSANKSECCELLDKFYEYINECEIYLPDCNNELFYVKYCFIKCLHSYTGNMLMFITHGSLKYSTNNTISFKKLEKVPVIFNLLLDQINLSSKINYCRNTFLLLDNLNWRDNNVLVEDMLRKIFPIKKDCNNLALIKPNLVIFNNTINKLDSEVFNRNISTQHFNVSNIMDNQWNEYVNHININYQLKQINDMLLNVCNESFTKFMEYTRFNFKLDDYFNFIKDVILFSRYEFMFQFINEYFHIKSMTVGNEKNINLAYFFQSIYPHIYQNLIIKFTNKKHNNKLNQHDEAFNVDLIEYNHTETCDLPFFDINIKFKVLPPFNEIFSSTNIRIYKDILVQNLLLKYILNRLYHMHWLDHINFLDNKYYKKRIYILRNIMIKFLEALSQFWSINGIHIFFKTFEQKSKDSMNFGEIVTFHHKLCKSLAYLYLITEEMTLHKRILIKIYECINEFIIHCSGTLLFDKIQSHIDHHMSCSFVDDNMVDWWSYLTRIEANFSKLTYLLKHYLSNMNMLQNFNVSMIYNEFIKANL